MGLRVNGSDDKRKLTTSIIILALDLGHPTTQNRRTKANYEESQIVVTIGK